MQQRRIAKFLNKHLVTLIPQQGLSLEPSLAKLLHVRPKRESAERQSRFICPQLPHNQFDPLRPPTMALSLLTTSAPAHFVSGLSQPGLIAAGMATFLCLITLPILRLIRGSQNKRSIFSWAANQQPSKVLLSAEMSKAPTLTSLFQRVSLAEPKMQ